MKVFVANGWPGHVDLALHESTTDEYARVGEQVALLLPAWLLWDAIHPDEGLPGLDRLRELEPSVTVTFLDGGQPAGEAAPSLGWEGDEPFSLRARTGDFVVPAGADAIRLEVAIADAATPGTTTRITGQAIDEIPVFGGDLPNKTALFDSLFSSFHTRVVEGGRLVPGADVTIAYTDWRADTVVDRMHIPMQIGVRQAWGRFGEYTMPILGTIEHDVLVGHAFDDGQGFRAEQALAPNTASRLLPEGRTAYEATLAIPAGATRLAVYFHVKTHLVADYTGYDGVVEQWYPDGSRTLVRERWDNPFGPYTNHEFELESP